MTKISSHKNSGGFVSLVWDNIIILKVEWILPSTEKWKNKLNNTYHSVNTSISWTVCVPVGSSSRTTKIFELLSFNFWMSRTGSWGHSGGREFNTASFLGDSSFPSTLTPVSVS